MMYQSQRALSGGWPASSKSVFDGFQQASTMDHGQDMQFVVPDFVDETVAIQESLTHISSFSSGTTRPSLGWSATIAAMENSSWATRRA